MGIDLTGRVAIVTGGANGIGRATALAFARAGAHIAVWDRAEQAGQAVVAEIHEQGGQALFANVDVTTSSAVDAAVEAVVAQFGRVDILINNAGITRDARLVKMKQGELTGKMSEADFDAVINVNLKAVFTCTQAVAPLMIRQNYGRIISAASVVALYATSARPTMWQPRPL